MPEIVTKKIESNDLNDPIEFDGESGQIIVETSHSNLSQLDMTINLDVSSAVIQYFTSDMEFGIVERSISHEEIYLEHNSEQGKVYEFGYAYKKWYNIFLTQHWPSLTSGSHTFRIRDVEGAQYRNSKHIVLVLRV